MTTIGFIGVGQMGSGMAKNLAKAGFQVRAFDLNKAALKAVAKAGVKPVGSLAEVAKGAGIIFSSLPSFAAAEAVYFGKDNILSHVAKGTILIETSTITLDIVRREAAAAAAKGCELMDAPIAGGPWGAAAGTLTVMIGGAKAAFKKAEPAFRAIGEKIIHVGPSGHGMVAKLCNNMLLQAHYIALCESFALGERLGVDGKTLYNTLSQASARSYLMDNYCPAPGATANSPANEGYTRVTADGHIILKDLTVALEAAKSVRSPVPLTANAFALYTMFVNGDKRGLDWSGAYTLFSDQIAKPKRALRKRK
ncbi:MAG: 3-hydroxyisobutyrate dehydrogenase [Alphaproteobacteria bacterium]|nr:3-hydroxyisobutyrate dehydrogenase [Alphaproteobacteria bacterium]